MSNFYFGYPREKSKGMRPLMLVVSEPPSQKRIIEVIILAILLMTTGFVFCNLFGVFDEVQENSATAVEIIETSSSEGDMGVV